MKKEKLNLLDIMMIIVIIITIFLFGYKILNKKNSGIISQGEVKITFYSDKSPDYSLDGIKKGNKVSDDNRSTKFGIIISEPIIKPSKELVINNYGEYVLSEYPRYKSIEFTTKCKAIINDSNVIIDSQSYNEGMQMVIRTGLSKLFMKIKNIEIIENQK